MIITGWLATVLCVFSVAALSAPTLDKIIDYDYTTIKTLPHSTRSFTQGLTLTRDTLYESSGLFGRSFIERYRPLSGELLQRKAISPAYFAEGLAVIDDTLYALTWKAGIVLMFNADNFAYLGQQRFNGEGWGLTVFHQQLLMSNGSATLTLRNPKDFSITRQITVTDRTQPIDRLNDLTIAYDRIWANVWHSNTIVVINPSTGAVEGKLDLSELAGNHHSSNSDDVLNGIAWDHVRQGFWVTGKRWNKRYLIGIDKHPIAKETSRQ